MIAEKLPITFDVSKLQDYYRTTVKQWPAIWQNDQFGGWSILSTSGDYADGFQQGHLYFVTDATGRSRFDYERAHREAGFTWPKMHVNFTQVGTDYVASMIQQIRDLRLNPHRARWTIITPSGATTWHRDMADNLYGVRLHIPVITNPDCAFITDEGSFHMPADGSCYLVAVNKMHKAVNLGQEDRIHIIMDVIDDSGVSQHHTLEQHIQNYAA